MRGSPSLGRKTTHGPVRVAKRPSRPHGSPQAVYFVFTQEAAKVVPDRGSHAASYGLLRYHAPSSKRGLNNPNK